MLFQDRNPESFKKKRMQFPLHNGCGIDEYYGINAEVLVIKAACVKLHLSRVILSWGLLFGRGASVLLRAFDPGVFWPGCLMSGPHSRYK